jgi:cytochrome c biogenesis protein CcmG, thiol:disulfide interchange protein DsbE
MKKRFISALFLLVSVLVFAKEIKVKDNAPDFTIKTQNGEDFTLLQQKKPVLVHFWATWCPPCVKELPEMQKLYDELQSTKSDLEFIAICISDTEEEMNSFMQKNNYTFACGLDSAGEKIANSYEIQGVPTSMIISPEGKVLKVNIGMMTPKQLEKFVKDVK